MEEPIGIRLQAGIPRILMGSPPKTVSAILGLNEGTAHLLERPSRKPPPGGSKTTDEK